MSSRSEQTAFLHPEQVFVMSGPSGVGKNSVASALCESGSAVRALTATSRPPRPGERDGMDYYFVSDEQFEDWLRQGRLLEHTRYCGHYYGTPAFSVNRAAESGRPVLLVVDVQGALTLKERWPEVRLIFLVAPSEQALARRLRSRGQEDEAAIASRLRRAREETALKDRYDWTVVNEGLEEAVEEVRRIIEGTSPAR